MSNIGFILMRNDGEATKIIHMNTQTHRIGEQGAAMIDTTAQEWGVKEVNTHVLEQQAKDALAFPHIFGEHS